MTDWMPRDEITAPVTEAEREAVRTAQRALLVTETGQMDEPTQNALKALQELLKLPATGALDRATAAAVDRLRHPSLKE